MLTIPATGGLDSTALIVGDFSNGNDGIVLKGKGKKLADIKGLPINLVELSVSHYLLARALDSVGLKERDVKVVNTSDADIVAAFATADSKATVTWNPQLTEILAAPNAQLMFDSSKIPGEIIDMMIVNTATLKSNPALGKALVGAWYETMQVMSKEGCEDTSGADAHGESLRHRSRRLQQPACQHEDVLDACRGLRLHHRPATAEDHGSRSQILIRTWPAG